MSGGGGTAKEEGTGNLAEIDISGSRSWVKIVGQDLI